MDDEQPDVTYSITVLCNCGGTHTWEEWQACPLALVPINDPRNPRSVEFNDVLAKAEIDAMARVICEADFKEPCDCEPGNMCGTALSFAARARAAIAQVRAALIPRHRGSEEEEGVSLRTFFWYCLGISLLMAAGWTFQRGYVDGPSALAFVAAFMFGWMLYKRVADDF